MNTNIMFAVDLKTKEIIVSDSPKGSNTINFLERINQQDHTILYDAVILLTNIINTSNPNITVFKAMDKVCQILYKKYKETE
ncbi:hypothetical protein [Flavobacterium sp.]|uniref:hypothetical protein n=1 Tax=Flavobacterium sp. TaxID=239 RepID=UPI0038FC01E9